MAEVESVLLDAEASPEEIEAVVGVLHSDPNGAFSVDSRIRPKERYSANDQLWCDHARMQDVFLESAGRYARRAVKRYLAEHWHDFYADAGIALEHLAKALLVSYHPTFIIGGRDEGGDFPTLLFVTGFRHLVKKSESKLRTIGCRQAVERCQHLLPVLKRMTAELNVLIDARNGVLHFARVEEGHARASLLTLARTAEVLLGGLSVDPFVLWGEYNEVIRTQLSEDSSETQQMVAGKLAQATARYRQRYGDGEGSPLLAALRAVHEARILQGPDEQELECPACGTAGVVHGYTEVREEPEEDHDGDDWFISGVSLILVYYPASFTCSACDLGLADEEFRYAGVDTAWDLDEEVDPADYWEPDEDMLRGR